MENMRRCTKCGIEYPATIEYFFAEKRTKIGLQSWCRKCQTENRTRRRIENPGKEREYQKRRRAENPERERERLQRWRKANPDKFKAQSLRNHYAHKEQRNEYSRKNSLVYYRKHPEKAIVATQVRRARKQKNGGKFTLREWEALKAKYDYRCLKCGKREPEIKLTVDHVIPLSKGGSNNIDNIQPLCRSCNCSKKSKTVDYRPGYTGADPHDLVMGEGAIQPLLGL